MSDFYAYLTPSRVPPIHDTKSSRDCSPRQAPRSAAEVVSDWNRSALFPSISNRFPAFLLQPSVSLIRLSELVALGITPCLSVLAASSAVVDAGVESSGADEALAALRNELRSSQSAARFEDERARNCQVEVKRLKVLSRVISSFQILTFRVQDQLAAVSLKLRESERCSAAAAERTSPPSLSALL
jgi:hypothetical protein